MGVEKRNFDDSTNVTLIRHDEVINTRGVDQCWAVIVQVMYSKKFCSEQLGSSLYILELLYTFQLVANTNSHLVSSFSRFSPRETKTQRSIYDCDHSIDEPNYQSA